MIDTRQSIAQVQDLPAPTIRQRQRRRRLPRTTLQPRPGFRRGPPRIATVIDIVGETITIMSVIREDPAESVVSTSQPNSTEDGADEGLRSPRAAKGKWKAEPAVDPPVTPTDSSASQGRSSPEFERLSEDSSIVTTEPGEDTPRGLLDMLMACFICGPQSFRSLFDVGPDPYADPRSRGQYNDSDRRGSIQRIPSPDTPPSIVAPHLNKAKGSPSPTKSTFLLTPPDSPNRMHEPERGIFKPRYSTDMYSQEYLDQQRYEALQNGVLRPCRTHHFPLLSDLMRIEDYEDRMISVADEILGGRAVEHSLIVNTLLQLPIDETEIIFGGSAEPSVTFTSKKEMISLDPPIECCTSFTLPEPPLLFNHYLPTHDPVNVKQRKHLKSPETWEDTIPKERQPSAASLWDPAFETDVCGFEVPVYDCPVELYEDPSILSSNTLIYASQVPADLQGGKAVASAEAGSGKGEGGSRSRQRLQEPFPSALAGPGTTRTRSSESDSGTETSSEVEPVSPETTLNPVDPFAPSHQGRAVASIRVVPPTPEQAEGSIPQEKSQHQFPPQQQPLPEPHTPPPFQPATVSGQQAKLQALVDPGSSPDWLPPTNVAPHGLTLPPSSAEGIIYSQILGPPIRISRRGEYSLNPSDLHYMMDDVSAFVTALEPELGVPPSTIDEIMQEAHSQPDAFLTAVPSSGPALLPPPLQPPSTSSHASASDMPSHRRSTRSSTRLAERAHRAAEGSSAAQLSQQELPRTIEAGTGGLQRARSVDIEMEQEPVEIELDFNELSALITYQEPIDFDPDVAHRFEQDVNQTLARQIFGDAARHAPDPTSQLSFTGAGERLSRTPSQTEGSPDNPLWEFASILGLRPGSAGWPAGGLSTIDSPQVSSVGSSTGPPQMEIIAPTPRRPTANRQRGSYGSTVIRLPSSPASGSPRASSPISAHATSQPPRPPRPSRLEPPGGIPLQGRSPTRRLAPLRIEKRRSPPVNLANMSEEDKMMLYLEEPKELRGQPWIGPRLTMTPATPEIVSGPSFALMPALPTPSGSTGGYVTPASEVDVALESGSEGYVTAGEGGESGNSGSGSDGQGSGYGLQRGKKRSIEDVDNGGGNGSGYRPAAPRSQSAGESSLTSKNQGKGKGKGKDPEEEEGRLRYRREH
ncbi:hypothetical protein IAT40_002015 [Kwoniella sp. CBS 6097]